jgi:CDP-6-deoxy-D-xylo-4-hexulose-3-dehydrase
MKSYLLAERTIDKADLTDLKDWLETDPWLTQGPLVRQFEAAWAAWLGRKHALFVNSGSSANLLMYAALLAQKDLPNRKVIVPAVSWATTVAPAIQLGFEPIMCDADPQTFGLDLTELEALCQTHKPATVIAVHVLGTPNDMERLCDLRRRYGFVLLEDACAATGSRWDGAHVGTFGELSSFSFFYGHHLSTIEGGMVTTDDEATHDLLLQLRSHGWAKDLAPEKGDALARQAGAIPFNKPFTFYLPGFNVRGTDLQARIGLSQLKKADHVVARRAENHRRYQERFPRPGRLPDSALSAQHHLEHLVLCLGQLTGPPRADRRRHGRPAHRDAPDRRWQHVASAVLGRALWRRCVPDGRPHSPDRVPAAEPPRTVAHRRGLYL